MCMYGTSVSGGCTPDPCLIFIPSLASWYSHWWEEISYIASWSWSYNNYMIIRKQPAWIGIASFPIIHAYKTHIQNLQGISYLQPKAQIEAKKQNSVNFQGNVSLGNTYHCNLQPFIALVICAGKADPWETHITVIPVTESYIISMA